MARAAASAVSTTESYPAWPAPPTKDNTPRTSTQPFTPTPPPLAAMCVYSALFARFAWMIQPRNYLLLACHISNETVQLNQLRRWASVQPWAAVRAPAEGCCALELLALGMPPRAWMMLWCCLRSWLCSMRKSWPQLCDS